MSARNIRIVYVKELIDLLRDRRTIISMIVVPIVLMPTIIFTMGSLTAKLVGQARQEKPRIMIIGGQDSPATLAALHELKDVDYVPASDDFTNLISDKHVRAAVELPKGFDESLRQGGRPTVRIYTYEGEMKSSFAAETIEKFFRQRKEALVSDRLAAAHVSTAVLTPFDVQRSNVAPPQKVSGNITGMILPYLVIVMCMTGSIYPSVDLTAGEKERGTMETLLTSPVSRTHLVLGKGLVVMTVSLITASLALVSNGLAFTLMKAFMPGGAKSAMLGLTINPTALLAVGLMIIPLAVFFAALMVAIGLYSRSAKEANSYLQPLLIFTVLPALAAALPGMELNSRLALVPILNVSLLCRELLTGSYHWHYLALVFVSMCAYAGLAIAAAVAAYKRETVLFRA
ncbi:MAG TPA: ABC transporter permease [Verrucomicrobiae bacterium]|jgi:sodium transport system permease protein|nr:ABC transporter permease [Verrucomicrobiae bacterium]